jgi:hypothetical protein
MMRTKDSSQIGLNNTEKGHLERLRSATTEKYTPGTVPRWIQEKTFLRGKPFSFKDREYQARILGDDSQEVVIKKPSQVGISEMSLRMALALANIVPYYTIAYTLPTAGFASTFVKTRLDPVIGDSPTARDALDPLLNNSEVKGFGSSYVYFRGCAVGNAAISIAVDHLLHDEVDFSDPEILSQYESRITASPYKRKTKLSTPTLPDYGIDMEFKASRRFFNMVKCDHCNHHFLPDYYKHVRVPGYDRHLDEIKKNHLPHIRWQEAQLLCPNCGKVPSLQAEHREWVQENPGENHVPAGYQVQPFDAPNIVTIPSLVKTSTNYLMLKDFRNFGLGMTMEDSDAMFSREEVNSLFVPTEAPKNMTYVIGADLGMTCHLFVGAVAPDESILVVHAERVPIGMFKQRLMELSLQWNVSIIVSDSQPYTETVMGLQPNMSNLWGAIYIRSKTVALYDLKELEPEADTGKSLVRQVNINRDKGFDAYMGAIRGGMVVFKSTQEQVEIVDHHTDMKRVKIFDADNEIVFTWKKSPLGNDHYHHAGLYMYIASRMRGVAHIGSISSFAIQTFILPEKVLNPVEQFWQDRRGWGKRA